MATGLAWAGSASARLYNYQDLPVGERSFGMGTVSVAVEGDTGTMFSNPGVLGTSRYTQFSASLSTFARMDPRTGEFVSLFQSAAQNITRDGFVAVPSMVGGHVKNGSWVWGGAVMVPQLFMNTGLLTPRDGYAVDYYGKDESYWYGLFASRPVTSDLSCGATFFYASRSASERVLFAETTDTDSRIRILRKTTGSTALVGLAGCHYRVNNDLAWGASFRAPPIALGTDSSFYDANVDGGPVTPTRNTDTDKRFYPLPMRLSLGVSWRPIQTLLVGADVHLYSGLTGTFDNGANPEFEVNAKPIANLALGVEWMGWTDFGLRAGFFSNLSAAREAPTVLSVVDDKVHMFGGTASLVWDKRDGTISVGGFVQGGQGRASSLSETQSKPVPRSNYIYGAVLGSSYRFF